MARLTHTLAILLGIASALLGSLTAQAHSGGLDANGCHAGSQPYHCHRSPNEMVGNRLRCDLGSSSVECIGGSEQQVSANPMQTQSIGTFKCPDSEYQKSVMVREALDRGDAGLYQRITDCNASGEGDPEKPISGWSRDFTGSSGSQIRMKNVACEKGKWRFDLVNKKNGYVQTYFTFWTVDEEGDSLGSFNDDARLPPMGRLRLSTDFNCGIPFDQIKMKFSVY